MKKILIILAVIFGGVTLLALLDISPQHELHKGREKEHDQVQDITQRPIDEFGNDTGEEMDSSVKTLHKHKVCCRTGAVVPHPKYSYTFVEKGKCQAPCKKIVDADGRVQVSCAVGLSYRVVDDRFCVEKDRDRKNEKNTSLCRSTAGKEISLSEIELLLAHSDFALKHPWDVHVRDFECRSETVFVRFETEDGCFGEAELHIESGEVENIHLVMCA